MLSGIQAKIFGFGLGLVLTKVVLVASSVIEITLFTLRSYVIGNYCLNSALTVH